MEVVEVMEVEDVEEEVTKKLFTTENQKDFTRVESIDLGPNERLIGISNGVASVFSDSKSVRYFDLNKRENVIIQKVSTIKEDFKLNE